MFHFFFIFLSRRFVFDFIERFSCKRSFSEKLPFNLMIFFSLEIKTSLWMVCIEYHLEKVSFGKINYYFLIDASKAKTRLRSLWIIRAWFLRNTELICHITKFKKKIGIVSKRLGNNTGSPNRLNRLSFENWKQRCFNNPKKH